MNRFSQADKTYLENVVINNSEHVRSQESGWLSSS
jgi:hypothetical protein